MQNAKLYLAQALIELMERKELEEIHVKEIVERAGVSRMTYYRYFQNKEDILSFYMRYIFDAYMEQVETKHHNRFRSYEHILESLLFFKEYKNYAKCLYKAGMSGIMLKALNEYVERQPVFDAKKTTRSYPLYFYAGALYNVYMQWVLEDTKTPANELALIISKTTF